MDSHSVECNLLPKRGNTYRIAGLKSELWISEDERQQRRQGDEEPQADHNHDRLFWREDFFEQLRLGNPDVSVNGRERHGASSELHEEESGKSANKTAEGTKLPSSGVKGHCDKHAIGYEVEDVSNRKGNDVHWCKRS